jgi:hypothetical protein
MMAEQKGRFVELAVMIALGVAMFIYMANDEKIPDTLQQAGLDGKARWSDEQQRRAVKITRKALASIDDRLEKMSAKGDAPGAVTLMDPAQALLMAWNDHVATGANRNCQLAAAHLAGGILSVAQGGGYMSRNRFENALDDCR